MDQGLEPVRTWLRTLFEPYARAAYQLVRAQHALPTPSVPSSSPPTTTTCLSTITVKNATLDAAADFIPISSTTGHLALFNQHLQKQQHLVEWIYGDNPEEGEGTKMTPVWTVRVFFNGEVYGYGRGNTKKVARNEAAKEGLEKLGVVIG